MASVDEKKEQLIELVRNHPELYDSSGILNETLNLNYVVPRRFLEERGGGVAKFFEEAKESSPGVKKYPLPDGYPLVEMRQIFFL